MAGFHQRSSVPKKEPRRAGRLTRLTMRSRRTEAETLLQTADGSSRNASPRLEVCCRNRTFPDVWLGPRPLSSRATLPFRAAGATNGTGRLAPMRDYNAATVGTLLTRYLKLVGAHPFDHPPHQPLPYGAHHGRVASRDGIEWAVSSAELAARPVRLKADGVEYGLDALGQSRAAEGPRTQPASGSKAERFSESACRIGRADASTSLRDPGGEQAGQERMIAVREADRQPPSRAPVELGGSTGSRTRAPRQATVVCGQQAGVDETVEVKGCHRAAQAERLRRFVAADRRGPPLHVFV
jgi:hypothetical protein